MMRMMLMSPIMGITAVFKVLRYPNISWLLIVAIGGCGVGLYMFAPDLVILVYLVSAVIVLAFSLMYAQKKIGVLAAPKCLAMLLVAVAAGVVFSLGVVPAAVKASKFAFLSQEDAKFLPEWLFGARDALSAIAASVWTSASMRLLRTGRCSRQSRLAR